MEAGRSGDPAQHAWSRRERVAVASAGAVVISLRAFAAGFFEGLCAVFSPATLLLLAGAAGILCALESP
jgi:hypothetical protein